MGCLLEFDTIVYLSLLKFSDIAMISVGGGEAGGLYVIINSQKTMICTGLGEIEILNQQFPISFLKFFGKMKIKGPNSSKTKIKINFKCHVD